MLVLLHAEPRVAETASPLPLIALVAAVVLVALVAVVLIVKRRQAGPDA